MIDTEESDLIGDLNKGSKGAFEKIFYRYHKRIYNFCLKMLPGPDDAEEITQDVFVALWEQKARIDKSKPLPPYLFTIAKYMVYSELRKIVYRQVAFEEIARNETSYRETTKDEVLFNELTTILRKLIDLLPPKQKEIFRMSRDSGLSYKEISAKLGISENTVDTQIRRSLDFLRKEYEIYFNRK